MYKNTNSDTDPKPKAAASDVVVCKHCGLPYQLSEWGFDMCRTCTNEINEGLGKMIAYFAAVGARYETDADTMDEFIELLGIQKWVVLHLLREEKITMHKTLEGGLTCQFCKKPIATGRSCVECKTKLAEDLAASKSSRVSPLNPGSTKEYHVKKSRRLRR